MNIHISHSYMSHFTIAFILYTYVHKHSYYNVKHVFVGTHTRTKTSFVTDFVRINPTDWFDLFFNTLSLAQSIHL